MKLGKLLALPILIGVGFHYLGDSDANTPLTPAPAAFSQNVYPDLNNPAQAAYAQTLVGQFAAAAVMTGTSHSPSSSCSRRSCAAVAAS